MNCLRHLASSVDLQSEAIFRILLLILHAAHGPRPRLLHELPQVGLLDDLGDVERRGGR